MALQYVLSVLHYDSGGWCKLDFAVIAKKQRFASWCWKGYLDIVEKGKRFSWPWQRGQREQQDQYQALNWEKQWS